MFFFIRKIIIAVVFILPINTLLADNYPPEMVCTAQLSNEDLVGIYSLIMGPGLVSMDGMTMPFPETPKSPAKVFLLNDEVVISADDGHFDMTLKKVGSNETPWKFSDRNVFKSFNSDDLGLALGCKTTDLPRYSGKGWFMSEDNVKVPSTMKLIVHGISDAGIDAIGVMNSSAQGITFKVRMSLKGGDLVKLKSTINKTSETDNGENHVNKGKPLHEKNKKLNEKRTQEQIKMSEIKEANNQFMNRLIEDENYKRMIKMKEANNQFMNRLIKDENYKKMIEIQEANKLLLNHLQKK